MGRKSLTPQARYVLLLFMHGAAEMAERHGRVLAELSELGLSLARELHGRAMSADEPDQASNLALAFHRISRCVRQTIALEAKLERDRLRAEREAQSEAVRAAEAVTFRNKARVRLAVERCVWTEAEGNEAERLLDELDDLLEEESLSGALAAQPVEACIARIRRDLGLSEPQAPGLEAGAEPPGPAEPPAGWTQQAEGSSGRPSPPRRSDFDWRSSG